MATIGQRCGFSIPEANHQRRTGLTWSEGLVKEQWGHALERHRPPGCDFTDSETNEFVEVKRDILAESQINEMLTQFHQGYSPRLVIVDADCSFVFRLERVIDKGLRLYIQMQPDEDFPPEYLIPELKNSENKTVPS